MWTEILHFSEDDLIPVKSYHKYKLKSMEMYKYRTIDFNNLFLLLNIKDRGVLMVLQENKNFS